MGEGGEGGGWAKRERRDELVFSHRIPTFADLSLAFPLRLQLVSVLNIGNVYQRCYSHWWPGQGKYPQSSATDFVASLGILAQPESDLTSVPSLSLHVGHSLSSSVARYTQTALPHRRKGMPSLPLGGLSWRTSPSLSI